MEKVLQRHALSSVFLPVFGKRKLAKFSSSTSMMLVNYEFLYFSHLFSFASAMALSSFDENLWDELEAYLASNAAVASANYAQDA